MNSKSTLRDQGNSEFQLNCYLNQPDTKPSLLEALIDAQAVNCDFWYPFTHGSKNARWNHLATADQQEKTGFRDPVGPFIYLLTSIRRLDIIRGNQDLICGIIRVIGAYKVAYLPTVNTSMRHQD